VVSQSRRLPAGQDTIPAQTDATPRMGSWRSTSFRALRAHYERLHPGAYRTERSLCGFTSHRPEKERAGRGIATGALKSITNPTGN